MPDQETLEILEIHTSTLEAHTKTFEATAKLAVSIEHTFEFMLKKIEALEETVREMDLLPIKPTDGTS